MSDRMITPNFTPLPRVQIPASARHDEQFAVKILITHPMETGLRKDSFGEVIPRRIINTFICRYGGEVVFSVDMHEAVSANPFIEFFLRATDSGTLEFEWHEDGGAIMRLQHQLTVT